MNTVTHEILVNAPVEAVYDQWTRFEEFPRFMDAVTKVTHLDDRRLRWDARILGRDLSWDAQIDRLAPDSAIEWHSTSGPQHRGAVRFAPCEGARTKVFVELEYTPRNLVERLAGAVGLVDLKLEGDLKHFKEFVELESQEAPAWRAVRVALARPEAPAVRIEVREQQVSAASPPSATPTSHAHRDVIRV